MFALIITDTAATILECTPATGITIFNATESRHFTVRFFEDQAAAEQFFRESQSGKPLEIRTSDRHVSSRWKLAALNNI